MKTFALALAVLATVFLAVPLVLGAATPFFPEERPPPSVAVPVEETGMLKVMEVGSTMVELWGYCPDPAKVFHIGIVNTSGNEPPRFLKVKFEHRVETGYYTLKGLTPGEEYTLRAWAVVNRSYLPLGAVTFETPNRAE